MTFFKQVRSHGNFFTRKQDSRDSPFSSSDQSDSSELVYSMRPTAFSISFFFSNDHGMAFKVESLLWIFWAENENIIAFRKKNKARLPKNTGSPSKDLPQRSNSQSQFCSGIYIVMVNCVSPRNKITTFTEKKLLPLSSRYRGCTLIEECNSSGDNIDFLCFCCLLLKKECCVPCKSDYVCIV